MYKVNNLSYHKNNESTVRIGRIIYKHPKGYFITLEFDGKLGKFKESFYPDQVMEV